MKDKPRISFTNLRKDIKPAGVEQNPTLVIDATGVGFGGLALFLGKFLENIPADKKLSLHVIGFETASKQVEFIDRWKLIGKSSYELFKLRRIPNSILFSVSPSISTLAWIGKPIVQNINDLQSFLPNVQVNLFKRIYRWVVYSLVLRIASGITSISHETKRRIPLSSHAKKSVKVVYLSGELASDQKIEFYDFLVIAHSEHKRANYIIDLLSNEKFKDKSVAILGSRYSSTKVSKCRSFVRTVHTFSDLSDTEYSDLFFMSKSIVLFSVVGSEGFGLPIAQSIFANKGSFISQDPALMEISKGYSLILTGDIEVDRMTMANSPKSLTNEKNVFTSRSWKDVVDDFLEFILEIQVDSGNSRI
jgi:hypothetical protein